MFDVWKTGDRVVLRGDVPGVAPSDLDIRLEDGVLTLTAKVDSRLTSERLIRREYGVGDYKRQFAIAEAIDSGGISAQLRDGVVTIELPIAVKPQPRRIEIRSTK
jgi:HSP20 family protein